LKNCIKQLREAAGWTQQELALRLQVTRQTILGIFLQIVVVAYLLFVEPFYGKRLYRDLVRSVSKEPLLRGQTCTRFEPHCTKLPRIASNLLQLTSTATPMGQIAANLPPSRPYLQPLPWISIQSGRFRVAMAHNAPDGSTRPLTLRHRAFRGLTAVFSLIMLSI